VAKDKWLKEREDKKKTLEVIQEMVEWSCNSNMMLLIRINFEVKSVEIKELLLAIW